mgnify:CR=1 FL=1
MSQIYTIPCNRNEDVFIHAIPGHYVTASAHLNYYVGTSDIKHNRVVSVEAAKLLAEYYSVRNMDVDTVLCLYETQALGAYMAQELASPSMLAPNPDLQVYVLGPEYDTQGNMIFRDNLRRMIQGKNVVVLISCITSGRTVERAVQSARYYGGNVIGIPCSAQPRNCAGWRSTPCLPRRICPIILIQPPRTAPCARPVIR